MSSGCHAGISMRPYVAVSGLACVLLIGMATTRARASDAEPSAEKPPAAANRVRDPEGILNLDIEQLARVSIVSPTMSTEVTTVSKQESTVAKSPAAIYVITKEMIQRSSCNNIPDLLRLVPGVEVARIDAHTWAITIRGDNDRYTNKVLVLVDGRSVYSTVTGSVYWDTIDMLMEDIERIEVTRGPNGTLWGVNAVNGMINIITKKAKDTQGALVTGGGGTEDRSIGGARYGGTIGDDLQYRVYAKYRDEAPGFNPDGPAFDGWQQGRGGFRADWEPDRDKSNQFTFQGDCYTGTEGFGATVPTPTTPYKRQVLEGEGVSGGNVLARWTHVYDDRSDWMLQSYFDQSLRANSFWTQNVTNFDVEFQHRFPLGERQEITWGTEYRTTHDNEICDGFVIDFVPLARTTGWLDFFVQDQFTIVEDKLFFTVGSKFGYNDYTQHEYQPSGRLLYTPDNKHSAWAAISRAVGTSRRFDKNGAFTGEGTSMGAFELFPRRYGNPDLGSEDLLAYELGYRAQATERFSYDIALYYYDYENLRETKLGDPFWDPWGNLIYPVLYVDGEEGGRAHAYGGEVGGEYTITEKWRLGGSYSHIETTYNPSKSPRNQVKLISAWDLAKHWHFDADLRYVDELFGGGVPAYLTMDCQLAWRPRKSVEIAVIGRNLLQPHHPEFAATEYPYYVSQVERSVFGKVSWMY